MDFYDSEIYYEGAKLALEEPENAKIVFNGNNINPVSDGWYVDKEFTTPYAGMYKVRLTDGTYLSQRYFNMYRWHITDPIYFKEDLKVTIQALGWRSEGRYLPLQDDISSVAYWYSDTLNDVYPDFPSKNDLEII